MEAPPVGDKPKKFRAALRARRAISRLKPYIAIVMGIPLLMIPFQNCSGFKKSSWKKLKLDLAKMRSKQFSLGDLSR